MTTLEKIRAEIEHWESDDTQDEYQIGAMDMQNYVLRVIDKYAEQEPCEDAVSRQAVLNEFYDVKNLYERIKQLPSVRPQEPKIGYWSKFGEKWGGTQAWECSICKNHYDIHAVYTKIPYNYCPNCGAKMVESQESEDAE